MNNKLQKNTWLEHFLDNYELEKIKKLKRRAAKVEDILNLIQISENLKAVSYISWYDIMSIRPVIGQIMSNINNISRVYKLGIRGHNVSEEASNLLGDINNINDLKQASKEAFIILQNIQISENEDIERVRIGVMHIMSMLQSLMSVYFTPEQIDVFNKISSGEFQSEMSYAEEVNAHRMESFLKGSIYSSKDSSDLTRKVIREVLQNAVDAATKIADNDNKASVKLYVSKYGNSWDEDVYMDLTVVDNGVGMDLDTLVKNFYVYFQSGKEQDKESTGGFGIAKAVIQETPEEGWSIETNDIGSSSFHKNMYMGTKLKDQHAHPSLSVSRNGTQISLYKIPYLDISYIKNICSKYATGNVDIYINDELVKPIFDFSKLHKIDNSGSGIIDAVSSNLVEEEMARNIINAKEEYLSGKNLDGNTWNFRGENGEEQFIKVNYYMMKLDSGDYGRFYVRLNGQYQHENGTFPQCNIVCDIYTNIRPNEEFYPMDPGRDSLRSPVKETVKEVERALEELIRDITDNELFKEGLDIFIYNKDKDPITTKSYDPWEKQERMTKFIERMESIGVASSNIFEKKEVSPERASEVLGEMARTENEEITKRQRAMLNNVSQALSRDKSDLEAYQLIDDIIDILDTPCEIIVQKNFVSDSIAHEDIDLTSTLSVLWQKVLKIIIDGSNGISNGAKKEFIPGLIYSDKAIAMYSVKNPKVGRNYDTISINPMCVSSIVNPELFENYLAGKDSGEMEDSRKSITKDETPINRLSVFLFHEAIHEITHLLFPDYWSESSANFHIWVTKLENINHFNFTKIRDQVKRYMPQLKKDTDKLIRRIKKDIS